MSAFAALVIDDRLAVARTFRPLSIDANGVARWAEDASVYDAKLTAALSIKQPSKDGKVVRVTGKITIPIMDTVDTSKKLGDAVANVEFLLPKISDTGTRSNALALMSSFLASTPVESAVFYSESVY